ncbi:MAG: hypothetical protein VX112_05730 [Pseudomonadota bacterium]|nr:hypothetical protein [Pseudomonadota bacterium]
MSFLNKQLSRSIYNYEVIFHGPFLLTAFALYAFVPKAVVFWYVYGLACISLIFAINGLNKFFHGITTHIYEPSTRHFREAIVDTCLNVIDFLLKFITCYAFITKVILHSGAIATASAARYSSQFSSIQGLYQTGLPLVFTHLHRFLLEGRARPLSRTLSRPVTSNIVGAFFVGLSLFLEQPLFMAFGSLLYFSVGIFMFLDVVHHMLLLEHNIREASPRLILGEPSSMVTKVAWRITLLIAHLLSLVSWSAVTYLSLQYFLHSIPSVLGITLPSLYSKMLFSNLMSMGSKPIYIIASCVFTSECVRCFLNEKSDYDPNHLDVMHRKRNKVYSYQLVGPDNKPQSKNKPVDEIEAQASTEKHTNAISAEMTTVTA